MSALTDAIATINVMLDTCQMPCPSGYESLSIAATGKLGGARETWSLVAPLGGSLPTSAACRDFLNAIANELSKKGDPTRAVAIRAQAAALP